MNLAQCLPTSTAEPVLAKASPVEELLEALPAAVLLVDGDGRVSQCNPAAEELLVLPLRGQLWRDLIGQLFIPRPDLGDALQLHTGRLVSLSTRPLNNLRGQVLMLQDVTESHQLQQRMQHQRRLADMGQMAASLAHQIRTPLASAMLYVSQLKSPQADASRREHVVGKAMTSLRGLERLINDMLLFVNSGKGKLETMQPVSLLQELADEADARLLAQGIGLSCDISHAGVTVKANRTLLKSALQNLFNNAEQALEGQADAHIELSAQMSSMPDGETAILLCLRDNGPGIEPSRHEAIFAPFVSGRSSGTGLGLAVVRAVAQSFGGEVLLDSQPGRGSCFCLRLPCLHTGEQ